MLNGGRLASRGRVKVAFGSHICGRVKGVLVVSVCVEELVLGVAQGLSHSFAKGDKSKGNGGIGTYAFLSAKVTDREEVRGDV